MRAWLKEPLVHFFVAGALLFAAYARLDRDVDDEPRVVRITADEVSWLKEIWSRQWQREPDETELRGVVADYLKEQLLAREALALGLDVDDTVVRRRLAQKMAFLIEDTVSLTEPTDEELRALYDADRERYASPTRVSFSQVFFRSEAAAIDGLTALATRAVAELGDSTLLEPEHVAVDERAIGAVFGDEFAARVLALEIGAWRGPIPSAYGFHLVRINEREASQLPSFEDVRARVLEEWQYAERAEAEEQVIADLMTKYDIVVDESVRPLLAPWLDRAP